MQIASDAAAHFGQRVIAELHQVTTRTHRFASAQYSQRGFPRRVSVNEDREQ
ncbi:hypothetical protein MSIMFB_01763 [Mycobacterium simulans]|uniref:Uncharacterized protein n=1 Tax=Mycobacterium simulans TaxID=627089 RepID=A0A7Z7IIS6_9MYCO|nr:hypothetical protein MSIMFB_01763 [Mycobacterium simulans]